MTIKAAGPDFISIFCLFDDDLNTEHPDWNWNWTRTIQRSGFMTASDSPGIMSDEDHHERVRHL